MLSLLAFKGLFNLYFIAFSSLATAVLRSLGLTNSVPPEFFPIHLHPFLNLHFQIP